MNDYTKGILTGGSLILCFFMFVSAKSQSKNLGDIRVDSITVMDENGNPVAGLSATEYGGFFSIVNADGKQTVGLGTAEDGNDGLILTYNTDGKKTVGLGAGEGGGGILTTYNKHEVRTGYFGTGDNGEAIIQDGIAVLFDRYGDVGWSETGKK